MKQPIVNSLQPVKIKLSKDGVNNRSTGRRLAVDIQSQRQEVLLLQPDAVLLRHLVYILTISSKQLLKWHM